MAIRRELFPARLALGVILALTGLLTAGVQAQFGGGPPPYTPASGAKDLRAVLFNWTSHMGMLRGIDEHELIVTLEYQLDEVSGEHQLPDAGPEGAVHLHSAQRTNRFEHRGGQRPVRLE
jgi:hypothetical protein